jgi:hypothetical protein
MNENDAVIAVLRALGEGGSAAATRKVDQVIAELPAREAEAVLARCTGWIELLSSVNGLAQRRAWVESAVASIERLEPVPHTQFAMDP